MNCPFCTSDLSKVVDKRGVSGSGEIRRRRECLKCGKRYTTYESLAQVELVVIKRDGRREAYLREKLEKGLIRALEKRPGLERIQGILNRIEGKIRSKRLSEVDSEQLGKWMLSELKRLDPIAYLRFASVYRKFSDPRDFAKELKTL